MRASIVGMALASLALCAGCGAALEEAPARNAGSLRTGTNVPSPSPITADQGTWVSAGDGAPAAPPPRVLFREQRGSILIGEKAPPPEPERPRTRGRVDVSFHKAELDNALRFLADTGRFNLVVETGLTGQVTAELHGVDAFDALVTIAEANGASVRYQRGIVMVKKASATAVR